MGIIRRQIAKKGNPLAPGYVSDDDDEDDVGEDEDVEDVDY